MEESDYEDLMEHRLMRYFGQGATWRSSRGDLLPMPAHILSQLRHWYTISLLHEREVMRFLQEMRRMVNEPRQVEALMYTVRKAS